MGIVNPFDVFDYPNEQWLPCVGFKSYEVSDMGRIRSVPKLIKDARSTRNRKSKIMSQNKSRGYFKVCLTDESGKEFLVSVHRAVALAFIPNLDSTRTQVNHKNGDKSDNRKDNLEWMTASENISHAVSLGLMQGVKGERSNLCKLSEKDAREIKLRASQGENRRLLAEEFKINKRQVYRILSGERWPHL